MGKKKKVELEIGTEDDFTEEELKAMQEEEEVETKPEGEGDDKGSEGDEEGGEKESDEEGEGEDKGKDSEDIQGEGEEEGKGDAGEGEAGDKGKDRGDQEGEGPLEGAKAAKVTIDGEEVEGWISKSGKYIIPFEDVAKRDQARRVLKAENEGLKELTKNLSTAMETLKAEVAKLKTGQGDVLPEGKAAADIDFAEIAKKLYTSEEDAVEALQAFVKAVRASGTGPEKGSEGQQQEVTSTEAMTPEQIASMAQHQVAFRMGTEKLINENPKLQDPRVQNFCANLTIQKIQAKTQGLDEAGFKAFCHDSDNLLPLVTEAAKETLEMFGEGSQDTPSKEEKEAWRAEERKRLIQELKTSLNLREEDIQTLGDVRSSQSQELDPHKELDALSGEALEEAMEKMTPEERERYAAK